MSTNRGRSGRRWRTLVTNLRALRRPCFRCGQPIDYTLQWPDPDSFSADHIKPWSTHPELREDPANIDAAHLKCNQTAGNRTPRPTIGSTSTDW